MTHPDIRTPGMPSAKRVRKDGEPESRPVERVVLQCVPLDDAAAQAVTGIGGNPMLEVTCR